MSELFDINVKSPKITENPDDYADDYYNLDTFITTEINDALKDFNEYEKKYTSENPTSFSEIDDNTIKMMFGDNWSGKYVDMTSKVSKVAEKLAYNMTVYSSVGEYLKSEKNTIQNNILYSTGLSQINSSISKLQSDYTSLTNTITNFKSFGIVTGSSNLLWNADSILSTIETTISSVAKLEDKVEDIISYIKNTDISGRDIDNLITEQYNNIKDIISQQDISGLLYNFPQSVVDKFMGTDFTQNLYTMPKQVYDKLSTVLTTLSSVQAPTNLTSTLETIKILKKSVAQMRDAVTLISNGAEAINKLKTNISSGNYIGVFLQAKDACKFVEKTSQFAAKYPYNQAYETEGRHIFETDNTPGKERLHVQHCSGTDVEIAPNGDMVSKIKNDCQFIVENDFQNHVKGNQLMLVDSTSEVQSKSMKLTASEDLNISSKDTTYTTDKFTLMSDDVLITTDNTLTVATNSSSSISCVGPLFLSSKSQIIMDAPYITIGQEQASVITLNSLNSITSNGVNTIINSTNTNINSNATYIGEGLIKLQGFITLN